MFNTRVSENIPGLDPAIIHDWGSSTHESPIRFWLETLPVQESGLGKL